MPLCVMRWTILSDYSSLKIMLRIVWKEKSTASCSANLHSKNKNVSMINRAMLRVPLHVKIEY